MGLKDTRRVVDNTIELHKERTFSPYTVYLEGPPNFLTWLSQNRKLSTQLMGSNVAYKAYGKDSPIKYSLIRNLPAWKISQMTLDSLDLQDDVGTESDINGELILAPGTIVPVPGDMFTINYLPKHYIFEITEAKPNIINSNHYYKCEFQLKFSSEEDLEEKFNLNIVDKYECIYENIGTDLKSVIRVEDFNITERLKVLYERLLDYYYEAFYEGITNCFINHKNDDFTYNQYLVEFFNKNDIFTSVPKYSHLTLTFEADKENVYNNKYRQSIYGVIESKKLTDLNYNTIVNLTSLYSKFNIFSQYNDVYKVSLLLDIIDDSLESLISKDLYKVLKNNEKINLGLVDTIIYKYLTKEYIFSESDIILLEECYNDTNNLDYNTMPVIIFIIKKSIEYYTTYRTNYKFEMDKGGIENI